MTSIDELRAMSGYPHTLRPELHKALEDAGIDYWVAQGLTFWNCEDGRECVAYGYQTNDGPKLAVKIVGFTSPAQVIAATVAQDSFIHESGMNEQTCTVESMHGFTDAYVSTRYFVELSCHTIDYWGDSEPPEFCPYCGRRVVDE